MSRRLKNASNEVWESIVNGQKCLVSQGVSKGEPIEFMIRKEPEFEEDSGWRLA